MSLPVFKRLFIAYIVVVTTLLAGGMTQASTTCSTHYRIDRGDTLYSIARRFNTSLANLQAWNNIRDASRIYAGQSLCVGLGNSQNNDNQTYVVQAGDTLTRIARRHGINWRVLAEVNNIRNANRIYVGQTLVIPAVTIQPLSS